MTNHVHIHQGQTRKDDVQEFALSECFLFDPLTVNQRIKTMLQILSAHRSIAYHPKRGRKMAQSRLFRFSNATNSSSLNPPEHLSQRTTLQAISLLKRALSQESACLLSISKDSP